MWSKVIGLVVLFALLLATPVAESKSPKAPIHGGCAVLYGPAQYRHYATGVFARRTISLAARRRLHQMEVCNRQPEAVIALRHQLMHRWAFVRRLTNTVLVGGTSSFSDSTLAYPQFVNGGYCIATRHREWAGRWFYLTILGRHAIVRMCDFGPGVLSRAFDVYTTVLDQMGFDSANYDNYQGTARLMR